ncbi:hypothetical protein SCUCBS95973_002906 [Sporothrix curviconia]|uniref:Xylanolytic transcriptional activator regulatory domain-containing protein n=1 Tax=Sporothrix curviconia TaxID=1260050 RepID=A0ABP0BAW3_9PEZI
MAFVYVPPLGIYGSYGALVFAVLVSIFKGFNYFTYSPVYGDFDYKNFITAYLGIPLYLVMILGYKPGVADFYSGKARIDREEEACLEKEKIRRIEHPPAQWEHGVGRRAGVSAPRGRHRQHAVAAVCKVLSETVLFHLGDIFHVFDRASFMAKIEQFYDDGSSERPLSTLWHVQLLLVIAFGKLFLRRGASPLGPPGATDFLRALTLQSDILDLWGDPILRIETLCLMTLYLMSCDMRATAYYFIGQGMLIALSLGMNRDAPPASLERHEYIRRRRLWWTLYIIDKKLSVIVGTPLSIRDDDIDIPLPGDNDLGFVNAALNLHIKLAELEGKVMSASYRINGTVNKEFIAGIQDLFAYMARLADAFTGDFHISLQAPRTVSRVAATLHIMYYQCTIIATRPIMFVLVKQRLAPFRDWRPGLKSVSEPVVTLLKTCVGAATTILHILAVLHQQDLVEPFLPLDLQSVFSAGLGWMCSNGNIPAKSRRLELAELQVVAGKINAKPPAVTSSSSSSSTGRSPSDTSTPGQQFRWLWDAPDIDNGALTLDMAASSLHLTVSDALMFSFAEDMITSTDWQWPAAEAGDLAAMPHTTVFTTDAPPPRVGIYSQAAVANGFVFCSGALPADTTGALVDGDIQAHTHQCFRNLSAVLAAAGSSLNDVVKMNVYLLNMADFDAMNSVYGQYFDEEKKPARTCIIAKVLPRVSDVEMECTAVVSGR